MHQKGSEKWSDPHSWASSLQAPVMAVTAGSERRTWTGMAAWYPTAVSAKGLFRAAEPLYRSPVTPPSRGAGRVAGRGRFSDCETRRLRRRGDSDDVRHLHLEPGQRAEVP